MSAESLSTDLNRAARRARGKQGNKTVKGRTQSLGRFAAFLWRIGFQIHTTGQIKEKHIQAWASDMCARNLEKRTVANNIAHIRTALEGIHRRYFADKVSNAKLGIAGASRAGTKVPVTLAEFENYRAAAAEIDPGVGVVLELELEFGLRAEEAIRSVESLRDWERALANLIGDGYIVVTYGTKGGKSRRCPPLDRERALERIRRAIAMMKAQRGRLIRKLDIEKALERYHYVVDAAGMNGEHAPHCLRYTYTVEMLRRLEAEGVSKRKAAEIVATFLGHGDSRGTYVRTTYGASEFAEGEAANV
ncbi:integrase domain-containing protein [Paraburkholderia saeva]|uniref:integrase domain-containing protein n=1 Tax=Paraburkholderia saeva TaxID=2777537 RepID=UPI001D8BFC45|nr:integrase domain-containing protein [Paraburkholderia saeva]CAG4911694.1 hypothetical protein R52603_03952 [Paraburkholderia saeva]